MKVRSELSRDAERRFFAWLCTAILAMVVIGFSRTYLLVPVLGLPDGALSLTRLLHLHAAIAFSWCLLLVAQAWLVAGRRVAWHLRLGRLGFVLYLGLVAIGPLVAVQSARRYGAEGLPFLAVSMGNIVAYAALFGAAFLLRRRPDAHKRLMILGMVAMLSAPFGRLAEWPWMLQHVVGPGTVVLALLAWDVHARGRPHLLSALLGPAILLWELLPNLYMESATWLTIAQWLVRTVP